MPAARVKPAGRAPEVTANVNGAVPPEAVMICVYAAPTWAAGNVAGLNVMTGGLTVRE